MRSSPLTILLELLLACVVVFQGHAQSSDCDDLSNVDFGECTAYLGFGIIDGRCTVISGCESPVPLFTDPQDCVHACANCDEVPPHGYGPCDALMGYGIVDGACRAISGCLSGVVPLFVAREDCEEACEMVGIVEQSWGTIKQLFGDE